MADDNEKTASSQIKMLQNLKQSAVTWLLGYASSRSVRDLVDIPRNPDGGYDARALMQWARGRFVQRPELPDDDVERIRQTVEWTTGETEACLLALLDDLRQRFGDGGLLVFISELLAYCRGSNSAPLDDSPLPDSIPHDEARQILAGELKQRRETWFRDRARIRVICDKCGRLRNGRRWLKADPAPGEPSVKGRCPTCLVSHPW
jgi:hypothetical protein